MRSDLMREHVRVLSRGAAIAAVLLGQPALAAVSLHISSNTVAHTGAVGQICVSLSTGGEQVAGTQNDLVWDGSCATLASPSSCTAVGSHGKQLQGGFPPQFDFTFRALILSLSDVDPMPDGPLYCCSFQSEAPPGECCTIGIARAGASDPRGNAIGVAGSGRAQICTAADRSGGGRAGGGFGGQGPGVASNVGNQPLAGAPAPAPAAPAPAPGAAAPPAANVLPGGGVRVPDAPAAEVAGGAPAAPPEIPTAVPAQVLPPGGLTPPQPPVAPPTAAATPASTTAAVADTPTAAAAPTAPPTVAAKPPTAAPKVQQDAAPAQERSWFGCQVAAASPVPLLSLGALLAAAAAIARRRRR